MNVQIDRLGHRRDLGCRGHDADCQSSPTAALAVPCPNVAIRGDPFGRGKAPTNEVISDGL